MRLQGSGHGLGRRGLLAGAATLIGAGLARLAGAGRAEAGHNTPGSGVADGADSLAVHLGVINTRNATTRTLIRGTVTDNAVFVVDNGTGVGGVSSSDAIFGISSTANAAAIRGVHANGYGVIGTSGGAGVNQSGVYGTVTNGVTNGVWGENLSTATNATGVFGLASLSVGATVGVWGRSNSSAAGAVGTLGEVTATGAAGIGVKGTSINGPGVYGTSTTAFGVQGLSTNAYGVSGNSTTQAGVWGSSNTNVGVLGTSTSGVGVNGVSVSSNGVNGFSKTGIGVYASTESGTAGRFDGNVVIQGNLTVSGTFPTSSTAAHADGTLRRLYSLESAEAYYTDVGQGSLTNGQVRISLDPDFAGLVHGDTYHVFLTPRGDCRGLYVSSQDATGFEVRELQSGSSSVGFSYRILARPRDLPTSRLDRVTLPPAPAQPQLDRVEPLDVPARLRDMRHPDRPSTASGSNQQPGQPVRVQDSR